MTELDHNRPLRVGLIGAGYVGEFRMMGLRRVPNAKLIGICDVDPARAAAAATAAETRAFSSTADLFTAGVDVVHILTPPHLHAPIAIEALEHGCHVLIEKPLATSLTD